uniref:F-box domain-containing protein n=1 Tax=Globodera rostochiensis TaxID=31243 RepID=A0A914I3K4_GLORO
MCSSSSTGSDSDAKISEQLSAININEKASVDFFGSVLPTEILVKIFDFLDNDHDSLEALHFTSKRMAIRVKPFLMSKRKKILDAFIDFLNLNIIKEDLFNEMFTGSSSRVDSVNFLDNCALLLLESEKYLKRVLRTNEYLSLSAHNLPVAQLSNVLLGVGGSVCDEDQLSREERALGLLTIARRHCYKFSIFYDRLTADLQQQYVRVLKENTRTKLEQALAYLIFKNFMYKYPLLTKFTDVIWPAGMAENVKVQLAKEYAEKNKKTAKFSKSRCMGRMYEMRTHGRVGNPYTTKPVHIRVLRQRRPYARDYYGDFY